MVTKNAYYTGLVQDVAADMVHESKSLKYRPSFVRRTLVGEGYSRTQATKLEKTMRPKIRKILGLVEGRVEYSPGIKSLKAPSFLELPPKLM